MAGRSTLIQSVNSAIPIHVMQSSYLPENVCDKLDRINRDFLWSTNPELKKLHLVGWDTVTRPKQQGGLRIRTARRTNEALLSKFVWKILNKDNTIWMNLVEAKYLKGARLLDCYPRPTDSPTWKGILKCTDLIKPYFRWRIGNGEGISFWYDNWLETFRLCDKVENINPGDSTLRLCDVLDEDGTWKLDSITTYIQPHIKQQVLDYRIQLSESEDSVIWSEEANGKFSCQSA